MFKIEKCSISGKQWKIHPLMSKIKIYESTHWFADVCAEVKFKYNDRADGNCIQKCLLP